MTTSGSRYCRSDGKENRSTRPRYSCFFKVRHPSDCDGQSGYGVPKLDAMVEEIVQNAIANQQKRELEFVNARLEPAKKQQQERKRDLEDLKAETLKIIRGTSSLSAELLNDPVNEANAGLLDAEVAMKGAETEIGALQASSNRVNAEYSRLLSWAEAYDDCSFEAKKMIVAQFVRFVHVYKGYELNIKFNATFEEFQQRVEQSEHSKRAEVKSLQPSAKMVDDNGIEPSTSALRTRRSPS